ncbi:DUF4123 domain-containing protein [Yoonia maritima]|uniref:DUF4123 domain-containing protein n=1 Tax=Yoonia maritima TaxID=1435347 RepID=UPI000D0F6F31|nr:DUF4123 domain-containing protein [Yoonia maritima]
MTPHDDLDDIWSFGSREQCSKAAQTPTFQIEHIGSVEPLDAQFGLDHPKTVPEPLSELFFGQPGPSELAMMGGEPDKVPPLQTYAILDAAKVTNFVEMLEASSLEHCCLFKGDAEDELKNVAPWIVRLEEGNAFTRNLFTRSEAPWHLWDSEPGIYLRSRSTLEDMRKHFRKFIKLKSIDEKWFYFRFWEASVIPAFLSEIDVEQQARFQGLFCGTDSAPIAEIYFISVRTRCCTTVKGHPLSTSGNLKLPIQIKLTEEDFTDLAKAMRTTFFKRMRQDFEDRALAQYGMSKSDFSTYYGRTLRKAADYQMVTEKDVASFVYVTFEQGITFWDKPDVMKITSDKHLKSSHRVMDAILYRLKKGDL